MLRRFDVVARSLLIVGGLNWLSVGAGKFDLVAWATRSRYGKPNVAARTLYGIVGGAALYSLSRWVQQTAFGRRGGGGLDVRNAMSSEPRAVEPTTPVVEVARVLRRENVGSVPVVEGGRLVGIVTDRDIALRVTGESRDPGRVTAGEVASRDLVTVAPDERLDEALRLMAKKQVRRLPVVEGDRLVGMLAQRDVALAGDDAQTGSVVEEISR